MKQHVTMIYNIEVEGSDVSIVTYTDEYSIETLNITSSDLQKYGPPRGLKYTGSGVIIPIPTRKSVNRTIKKLVQSEIDVESGLSKDEISEIISSKLAKQYFG